MINHFGLRMVLNLSSGVLVTSKHCVEVASLCLQVVPRTGYGNHGDYVFGWKGNSLQKIMDTSCYVNCPGAKQSMSKMNQCNQKRVVKDQIDGCRSCPVLGTLIFLCITSNEYSFRGSYTPRRS
jgi:hypothetical protein